MHDIDLDFGRDARIGVPEIVYGESKSATQLQEISRQYESRGVNLLITRCQAEQVRGIEGEYDPVARTLLRMQRPKSPIAGLIGVVYAGSSDASVAKESLVTLRFLGCQTREFGDCGVAGIHRLMAHRDALTACNVLICCAGFEGALASVLGGLMPQPIIAVPTSVGYGVAAGGHAALHGMLASCASGIMVMNIDNGCGAAMAAQRILRQIAGRPSELDGPPGPSVSEPAVKGVANQPSREVQAD
ncbi:nickel pincer cofactor biosynthesis protein LarB [Roseiconus nitratireducens]|uniref:Nickel pincer cofactor biosynthesis protein LarB n=1 Tax=Roseiconus nitratireducens TaxID=2605748 RepID=A0A5M6DFG8_9BACT|nr:nickel pincer cofactor biosynthesis protein LarB [Roseiconus nitratireducens]KAA5546143.1 nickel pincer cofactor biosynthesis protein LarB [Roseiconus nitratireducens]